MLEPADASYPMDNLYTMPGHLIRRVQQISSALFAEECGSFDLTSVQYAALVAIRANPQVDATRLSALIAFDRSTLGDVLERLEAKGWVQRSSSPNDKRVKLLRLSRQGARLLERVEPAVRRVQERLLAPLAPNERAMMVQLLTRLADLHNEVLPAPLRAAE
jgi:MarR family transcriptional regulator, lower aerobic nicotinate degradation pathway regulator